METNLKSLKILNSDGQTWEAEFDPHTKLESIKEMALGHFYQHRTDLESFDFRLIHVTELRTVADYHSVEEEKFLDNETLFLVPKRNEIVHEVVTENELKAPTKEQILEATKNIPPSPSLLKLEAATLASKGPSNISSENAKDLIMLLHHESADPSSDFQVDLRKILISLICLMTEILQDDPDVQQILHEMQSKLQKRVTRAVLRRKATVEPGPSSKTSSTSPSSQTEEFQVGSTTMGLIESIIRLKKIEFRPDQKAIDSLHEMGFKDEQKIIDALRANKNKSEKAAEWLLSGENQQVIREDIAVGLDPSSHLYNSLTTNPTIRLGLSYPKTLLALLGIIDTSSSAILWMNDPDTSNVITTIFKVYHAEKHSVEDNTSSNGPGPSNASGLHQ